MAGLPIVLLSIYFSYGVVAQFMPLGPPRINLTYFVVAIFVAANMLIVVAWSQALIYRRLTTAKDLLKFPAMVVGGFFTAIFLIIIFVGMPMYFRLI